MKSLVLRSLCLLLLSLPFYQLIAQGCPPRDLGGIAASPLSELGEEEPEIEVEATAGEVPSLSIQLAYPERAETWLGLLPLHGKQITTEGILWRFCSMDKLRFFLGKNAAVQVDDAVTAWPETFRDFPKHAYGDEFVDHLEPSSITGELQILVNNGLPEVRLLQPRVVDSIDDRAKTKEPLVIDWQALDIEFKDEYVDFLDAYMWKPVFTEKQTAMDGMRVQVEGLVYPIDIEQNFWMLTRSNPPNGCGFCCSFPSPDESIDVRTDSTYVIPKSGTRVSVEGRLVLNADDVYQMNYILEDVTVTFIADPIPLKLEAPEFPKKKSKRKGRKGRKPYTL